VVICHSVNPETICNNILRNTKGFHTIFNR
jgi:hypothetical protein